MGERDVQTPETAQVPEWLDDALCDALCAAHNGSYDGLTVTEHLERLIERVRTPPGVSTSPQDGGGDR